jgi:hypothetical protein
MQIYHGVIPGLIRIMNRVPNGPPVVAEVTFAYVAFPN